MIDTCCDYCTKFGLSFNPKKSKVMVFSKSTKNHAELVPILLNGEPMEFVKSIKYLGTTILSNPDFSFSSANELLNFYRSSNSILSAASKASEEVMMQLLSNRVLMLVP